MRAYQIMTPRVATVRPDTPVAEAAELMLTKRISGLPVVDARGKLVGIVSEGDFLRRGEIGTQKARAGWLAFLFGPGKLAAEYIREEGRTVQNVMTPDPVTIVEDTTLNEIVKIMERKDIKRLPVLRNDELIGIVTRANLLQAVASLARGAPQPSAGDDEMRRQILESIEKESWCPAGLNVLVRNGIVELSGIITDDRQRGAAVVAAKNVAGVKTVHDHLCWIDTMSGTVIDPRDDALPKAS